MKPILSNFNSGFYQYGQVIKGGGNVADIPLYRNSIKIQTKNEKTRMRVIFLKKF
jgi:hypothetical protein